MAKAIRSIQRSRILQSVSNSTSLGLKPKTFLKIIFTSRNNPRAHGD